MNQPDLVSIVVPAFNHERWVKESLQSAAAQTYSPMELIVVDDASRDATVAAVQDCFDDPAFSSRFSGGAHLERSRFNRGAHATLNRAIELAKGRWIAILNSDDRFSPERLTTLIEVAEARQAELIFSLVRMIDSSGKDVTNEDWFSSRLSHTQRCIPALPSVGFALVQRNVAISTGNLVFRRDLYERVGNFRPLAYCHDWDFILRAVLETEPVFVPIPLYDYRIHEQNSFAALASVADSESRTVLSTYFNAVRAGQFRNALAPGPMSWPGLFEAMISVFGMSDRWSEATASSKSPAAGKGH